MQDKIYDLVLWGASGFTGRLVAEYLVKQYGVGNELRWAIAGRNADKLAKIREELGATNLPILTADSLDKATLVEMVRQTKVVCSTVGPYALYGSLLVEACVENNIDYCDLTGEVQWIRKMIDTHHEAAVEKKLKIVHCCGFDSIPSEFGVYFLQKEAKARTGEYCEKIKMALKGASGGFSGGTYASLTNVITDARKDRNILKVMIKPYSLNPPDKRSGPDKPGLNNAAFDKDLKVWVSPFVMEAINSKIVRRSHALANYPYGESFRYSEVTWNGKGLSARIKANIMNFTTKVVIGAKQGSTLRKLIDKRLPKPGEGPSKEAREAGYFYMLFFGWLANGKQLKVKVKGDKDPGYGSTSKMLAESAVCLALDRENLPDAFGLITPTVAMGDVLMERLTKNAGLTFEWVE